MSEDNVPQENVEQPGEPQVADKEPGVEKEPQKEPEKKETKKEERTYTQEEWSKRESVKDKELGQLKDTLTRLELQFQTAEAEKGEFAARAKDKSDIAQGLITEGEAEKKQQERMSQYQQAAQMRPALESMGRLLAATTYGEKYNVNPIDLLNDKELATPEAMETRAKKISKDTSDNVKKEASDVVEELRAKIKNLEAGEPVFDKGQINAGGGTTNQSAKQLIKGGWEELDRKRKK